MLNKNKIMNSEEFYVNIGIETQRKKQVLRYIKENLSKGYSIEAIKQTLVKHGFKESLVDKSIKRNNTWNVLFKSVFLITLVFLVASLLLITLPPPIGLAPLPPEFITINESYDYTDGVNLTLNESDEYIWFIGNYGNLKSIRLGGLVSKKGSARVYLEYGDEKYLIFDSSRLDMDIGESEVVVYNDDNVDSENKSIKLSMDGESISELFEFNISGEFNWGVEHDKICTLWSLTSSNSLSPPTSAELDGLSERTINSASQNLILPYTEESIIELTKRAACYGSSECCTFMNISSQGLWDDSFYLSYRRYDSGLDNIVKAQIIYYDVNLTAPYSDIVISNSAEVRTEFYRGIGFEDVCIDSCLLPGFNETSYKLVFVIENVILNIDNIKYTIERDVNVTQNAPELVKEIKNITIYSGEFVKLNLSEYFYDGDGDKLLYSAYDVDNISSIVTDDIALLIPEYNFTGKRHTYFSAFDGYYNISSNVFFIDVVEEPLLPEDVNVSWELVKPRVVINEPVKWIKKVNVSNNVFNLSVNISSNALNVSVKNIMENKTISEDKLSVKVKGVIKNATDYRVEKRLEQIEMLEERLSKRREELTSEGLIDTIELTKINAERVKLLDERNKLTGYIVVANRNGLLTRFFEWLFNIKITGYAIYEESENQTDVISVIIEDIIKEIEVEYWTEGPISEEETITNGKRIIVSSDIHYENIESYTYLNDVTSSYIKLYHIINDSRILVDNISYYDENNNSLIDKIGWIIPSLSNETYEVIIEIIKAEHLDSNRSVIADVYDYVEKWDGNWSPAILAGEYVRVTFEQALDNTKDITIYVKSNNSNISAEIEVYIQDGNETITKFENISNEGWYKVYLTNLNGSHDVFDLKILNSSIEFDYIVDPKIGIAGNISFVPPTPKNDTKTTSNSVEINISIDTNLSRFKWNWNRTDYTFYNDSLVLMLNLDNISAIGENDSLAIDVSKYGNNGTFKGISEPKWNCIDSKYGCGLQFDGIDDYINISDSNSLDSNVLSIEFWFKPNEDYGPGSNYAGLIYHDDYEIFIKDGNIVFRYKDDNISSSIGSWSKGEWYYISATYDGSTQKLYTNGTNESSALVSAPLIIKNSNGERVASFFNSGNLILKGNCRSSVDCRDPGDDAFVIKDSGETVAYINSTGDLCIEDSDCESNDANCDNPGDDSFIIRYTGGVIVFYIDTIGNLCLTGELIENGNP